MYRGNKIFKKRKDYIIMKTWNTPSIAELSVKETAQNWIGIYQDGAYIGDGQVSGHLTFNKDEANNGGNDEPTEQLS